jgi:putative inorganic carbon (HCO3(-)) transporter
MLLLGIISTIFAKYVPSAIHGATFRYEGIFAIAYYLSLAFLASYTKNKKTIINTIICDGIIQTICSIFQICKLFKGTPYKYIRTPYASGFVYNQNFYGSLVLMCLLFSIGLFYDEKTKTGKILYGFIISLFSIGLILSNTTSCLIGLMIGLLYIIIYSIKKKEYKKLICITSIIVLASSIATKSGEITTIADLNQTTNEAIEISKGNFDDEYGSARISIWKQTIKYIPENIIHGVGVDNFKKINNGKGIYVRGELCGKAHNEYLQILITQGIFCLTAYLLFYSKTVLSGIKESFKNNNFYNLYFTI